MIGLVTGFLSSALPSAIELFKDSSDKKHEMKLLALQYEHANKQAALDREASIISADAELQAATVRAATEVTKQASTWVVNVNALIRPVITIMMLGLVVYAAIFNESLIANSTGIVVMSAEWTISYWFGKRCFDKSKGKS